MAVSLSVLAEKIGAKRRELSELQQTRQESIESYDAKSTELESLLGEIDSLEEPDSEKLEQAKSLETEVKSLRDKVNSTSDAMRAGEGEIASLEADYRLREEHNRSEERINSSQGRGAIGGDGARLTSSGGASDAVRVLPPTPQQMDHDMGVAMQCVLLSNLDNCSSASLAQEFFQNDRVASALQANTFNRGGSLIAGAFSDRFIELLSAKAIMRTIGTPTIPLDDGSLTIPAITQGSSSTYLGEGEDADITTVTTGDIKLVAKELVTILPASEKLLRSPSANAASIIRTDVIRSASLTEDLYFIRGSASGAGPTGLRYLAAAANIIPVNGTVNLANVTTDLGLAELALMENNVGMTNAHWLMAPRTRVYLQNLRDGNGNIAFLEVANGMLRNKPIHTTTQIPVNLGGGDESEIYLVDADEMIIGDAPTMEMEASKEAAYNDGGTIKAAFSRRQVVVRLVREHDFKARHREAIAVLTAVDWGA